MMRLIIPRIIIAIYRLRNIGARFDFQCRWNYFRIELFGRVFSIEVDK